MSSWRDETSQDTQDELDELLDVSLRTAKEKLDAAGEFYPFAVALDEPGATHQLTPEVKVGPRQVADVSQVFELCWVALRSEAADLRAAAVVTNVGGPDGDAVAVALEHAGGPAIEVFLPYTAQGKVNGKKPAQKHRYGDLQAIAGPPRGWA